MSDAKTNKEPSFDPNLWFAAKCKQPGCDGKHFLVANPHTFLGRMLAICPSSPWEYRAYNVSASDVLPDCSVQTRYWVLGYLNGSEPEPPVDEEGQPLRRDSPEVQLWIKEVRRFHQTGVWVSVDRVCEKCKQPMLRSEPGKLCGEC